MGIAKFHQAGLLALAIAIAAQTLAGCAATRGRYWDKPEESGFLGDYSQLKKDPEFPAALVYVRPGVDWSRYDSVMLESAGLWVSEETKNLDPEQQKMLTDVLYTKMSDALGKVFALTTEPGPNTLVVRVALTQAKGSKVALRVVTTVIPQLRAAGALIGLAGDTAVTVGSATLEMEVRDLVTHRRLAAAVDDRAGTKVLFAKRAYETWGDVEAACDRWSSRIAWQLARHGVQRLPGVPMPEEPSESRSF